MFAAARADGVPADVRSFATLIDGYAKLDNLQQAMMVCVGGRRGCGGGVEGDVGVGRNACKRVYVDESV